LTTLFGSTNFAPAAPAAKKNTFLPFLTVLFLVSYGLMTMLIVEQGRTIENQRAVMRDLLRDSEQLATLKAQILAQRNQKNTFNPNALPQYRIPALPSDHPSSQAVPQHRAFSEKMQKPTVQRPASDLTNAMRALKTI